MPSRTQAVLPKVNEFPSFERTTQFLTGGTNQCIWHLPDKGRLCRVALAEEDRQRALDRATSVTSRIATASVREDLAKLAEECCCRRHHYNKVYGSGLAQELAERWEEEIRIRLNLGPPAAQLKTRRKRASTPVEFAKYEAHKDEILQLALNSDIGKGEKETGSVYCFTHKGEVFGGMVKIGYTGSAVQSRLDDWSGCGNGLPSLVVCVDKVSYPERVEMLIHLELLSSRYSQRWCDHHGKAHIEWFKVESGEACRIIGLWCRWMERAIPYDRRGKLKGDWKGHVEFLAEHGCLTGEAMMQVQEIEECPGLARDFVDDDILRKGQRTVVKKEEE